MNTLPFSGTGFHPCLRGKACCVLLCDGAKAPESREAGLRTPRGGIEKNAAKGAREGGCRVRR